MENKISVIMASYLYEYPKSAKDRITKFDRAVNSFKNQNYSNKELIVVSDGCDITAREIIKHNTEQIKFVYTDKKPQFSGAVRDIGCNKATGDVICYLDTDDFMGVNHLRRMNDCFNYFNNACWLYYNDYVIYRFHPITKTIMSKVMRNVDLSRGSIGTSSIAHRNIAEFSWEDCDGYGHDWNFVEKLIKSNKKGYKVLDGFEYFVCHIPNSVDS